MPFSAWLDARDGETLAQAWAALDARHREVGVPPWQISRYGAAQLAAAFLGWPIERLAWLAELDDQIPTPTYKVEGPTARCFAELGLDRRECVESWTIHERTDGPRGVQLLIIYCHYDDGTREGGGATHRVVRVFDRTTGTGASIAIGARVVATIGDVDVTALDLFEQITSFHLTTWPRYDLDGVRGIVAQLAAEVDAHFDTSTEWPGRPIKSLGNSTIHHFESGPRSVELVEQRFLSEDRRVTVSVYGLPWGHQLDLHVSDSSSGTFGYVKLRLPLAMGQAVMGHLLRVPGLAVT